MEVSIQLANQIRCLGRDGLTVGQMADRLVRPQAEIMAALAMLGLPLPGEVAVPHPGLCDAERKALHDKMPKRMQDRINRITKREK